MEEWVSVVDLFEDQVAHLIDLLRVFITSECLIGSIEVVCEFWNNTIVSMIRGRDQWMEVSAVCCTNMIVEELGIGGGKCSLSW